MAWTLRPFRTEDQAPVIGLWEACGLLRPWNDPRLDVALKLGQGPELFLVAEQGEELVGTVMAGWDGHRGHVNYLAVRTDLRRQGLGRALMGAAEERLATLGCPKINLEVRQENRDVVAFYARLGYTDNACLSLGKRLGQGASNEH